MKRHNSLYKATIKKLRTWFCVIYKRLKSKLVIYTDKHLQTVLKRNIKITCFLAVENTELSRKVKCPLSSTTPFSEEHATCVPLKLKCLMSKSANLLKVILPRCALSSRNWKSMPNKYKLTYFPQSAVLLVMWMNVNPTNEVTSIKSCH